MDCRNKLINSNHILSGLSQLHSEEAFNSCKNFLLSFSQGKFNLITYEECLSIAQEGILCCSTELKKPEDVDTARQLIVGFLNENSSIKRNVMHLMLCISEASTNVIKYAGEGSLQIRKLDGKVRIIVTDRGKGLDFDILPNIITSKGFSTKNSLGYGFTIMNKFADKIYLFTSKTGTFLAQDFNG